jgi:glutamate formiminotransferase / 5-formyltetrahydrofolate cyclo-ligase
VVGVRLLRIGRHDEIERCQRIAQPAVCGEDSRPRKRGVAAARNEHLVVRGSRHGRSRRGRRPFEQRSPVGSKRASAKGRGCHDDHDQQHERDPRPWRGGGLGNRHGASAPARGFHLSLTRAVIESIQTIEDRERLVWRSALANRRFQQPARFARLAAIERGYPVVQQLFRFTLSLGERAASAIDVGTGAGMITVEEQRSRPDVDRLIVLSGEIVIEADEEQLLDLRLTIRFRHGLMRARRVVTKRVGHRFGFEDRGIIALGLSGVQCLQMSLIECVPNISEGRRASVIETLAMEARSVRGVRLLDFSADPSHNRSVFTMAGNRIALRRAVLAMAWTAVHTIDLRTHRGEHPRLGAVDVVPFIPLGDTTMSECVELARDVGQSIAERLDVPVFLYEEASSSEHRRRLEDIRRGQFEQLPAKMTEPEWAPDFGPVKPHPTAGATVVGARRALIAFNVNLATDRLDVARRVAGAVRERSGGLPKVKALGLALPHRGIVQVSMNLTDYERTSVQTVFDRVVAEASQSGVDVLESELIGLIPEAALAGTSADHLRLRGFSENQILERRLAENM